VLLAGVVRDGFMAVFMTAVSELDGVGPRYAGTALGLALTLLRVGALIAPPLGNALAAYGPRMPFLFWSAMALFGLAALGFLHRVRKAPPRSPDLESRLDDELHKRACSDPQSFT